MKIRNPLRDGAADDKGAIGRALAAASDDALEAAADADPLDAEVAWRAARELRQPHPDGDLSSVLEPIDYSQPERV